MNLFQSSCRYGEAVVQFLNGKIDPLVRLALRLFLANIFFSSGWLKFQNFLSDNWDATVYLFAEEHPVPFLPPEIAAVVGTGGELVFSILLAFGLLSRFAALGLLVMTGVIQFTYQASDQHILWAFGFALIATGGAGAISVDSWCARRCGKGL